MRVKIIISLIIIVNIVLPLSSNAQCEYGYLIDSNTNHPNGIWCWPPNATICYSYNSMNEPFTDAKDEIESAACEWSNASGYTISEDNACLDGNIWWVKDINQWHEATLNDSAAAVTQTSCTENSMYLNGFTMCLNCATFSSDDWSNICETNKIDLRSVVLHEFGHVLGLLDIDFCTQSVMYGSITRGECRVLHDIDKQAVQYLCDNAASRMISFAPVLKDGGVEIIWECAGYDTTRFHLESKQPWENKFNRINGTINNVRPNEYSYFDPNGQRRLCIAL